MKIFVARQPIFDRENHVAGYELLYRSQGLIDGSPELGTTEMASQVLVDSFLGIGLERLTNGLPAFLNSSRELLIGPTLELLDPAEVIIEILEDVEPEPVVIAACQRLAALGFRIALDDFVFSEDQRPLLEVANLVKIDVLEYTPEELEVVVERLRSEHVELLAEKVETRELHELCMGLGFEYFQGFFYSRPETVTHADLAVHHLGLLRLLNLLLDLETSSTELEEAFRADLPLSYKLMRIANSAAFGNAGISSIGHAIQLLGREPLYRWLALLLISSVGRGGGLDDELLRTVLVRARFCELIAESTGHRAAADSLFLVGLFSLLDLILGQSMEEALSQLALAPEVRRALLTREGPLAPVLELIEAYEEGRWGEVDILCEESEIDPQLIPESYLEALTWTEGRLGESYL